MAVDVGYLSAAGAGAISFLSPCVLPLVPPYLCYMAGVTVDDFRAGGEQAAKSGARTALALASLAFILGFTTVFVALGAGASTIGRFLRAWQEPLGIAAEAASGSCIGSVLRLLTCVRQKGGARRGLRGNLACSPRRSRCCSGSRANT